MTSEPDYNDYTDFDVIAAKVKEGMAPFKPEEIIIEVERTFIGDIKVIATVTHEPLMGTSYILLEDELKSPNASLALSLLGQKLYHFFCQLSTETQSNIERGEE